MILQNFQILHQKRSLANSEAAFFKGRMRNSNTTKAVPIRMLLQIQPINVSFFPGMVKEQVGPLQLSLSQDSLHADDDWVCFRENAGLHF